MTECKCKPNIDMFSSYENLEDTFVHCNWYRFPPCEPMDVIVVGGTSNLAFEMPFKFSEEDVHSIIITFKQEERLLFSKSSDEDELIITPIECRDAFTIECNLSTEETKQFGGTLLDTLVQVRVEYKDTVFFSDVYKVKVQNTLYIGD